MTHRLATIHTSQTIAIDRHCSTSATVSMVGYKNTRKRETANKLLNTNYKEAHAPNRKTWQWQPSMAYTTVSDLSLWHCFVTVQLSIIWYRSLRITTTDSWNRKSAAAGCKADAAVNEWKFICQNAKIRVSWHHCIVWMVGARIA